jgi:hypothetical protein
LPTSFATVRLFPCLQRAGDELLRCAGCATSVHQACYGAAAPGHGEAWYCRRCEMGIQPSALACVLCKRTEGAMKPVATGGWGHVICANWLPETSFVDPAAVEPIANVDMVHKDRYRLVCAVCGDKGGACVQCYKGKCVAAFHPSCLYAEGGPGIFTTLIAVDEPGTGDVTFARKAFCPKHAAAAQAVHGRHNTTSLHVLADGGDAGSEGAEDEDGDSRVENEDEHEDGGGDEDDEDGAGEGRDVAEPDDGAEHRLGADGGYQEGGAMAAEGAAAAIIGGEGADGEGDLLDGGAGSGMDAAAGEAVGHGAPGGGASGSGTASGAAAIRKSPGTVSAGGDGGPDGARAGRLSADAAGSAAGAVQRRGTAAGRMGPSVQTGGRSWRGELIGALSAAHGIWGDGSGNMERSMTVTKAQVDANAVIAYEVQDKLWRLVVEPFFQPLEPRTLNHVRYYLERGAGEAAADAACMARDELAAADSKLLHIVDVGTEVAVAERVVAEVAEALRGGSAAAAISPQRGSQRPVVVTGAGAAACGRPATTCGGFVDASVADIYDSAADVKYRDVEVAFRIDRNAAHAVDPAALPPLVTPGGDAADVVVLFQHGDAAASATLRLQAAPGSAGNVAVRDMGAAPADELAARVQAAAGPAVDATVVAWDATPDESAQQVSVSKSMRLLKKSRREGEEDDSGDEDEEDGGKVAAKEAAAAARDAAAAAAAGPPPAHAAHAQGAVAEPH